MKKLLTGVATFIAIASAVPAFASDVTADRNAQSTASTPSASKSLGSGPVSEAKKPACSCACMKAG